MVARTETARENVAPTGRTAEATGDASSRPWLDDVAAVAIEVRRLLDAQFDRARLRGQRQLWRAALAAPLVLAAATMSILAGAFVVLGLVRILREFADWPAGAAEVGVGLAVLAVFALTTAACARRFEARWLRTLEDKYGDHRTEAGAPRE